MRSGKICMYISSIIHHLYINQNKATIIYEYNLGIINMENSGRPTKRTKYMDMRHFVIQVWVKQDCICIKKTFQQEIIALILSLKTLCVFILTTVLISSLEEENHIMI